jgi:NAD(P)-dependent dehydrogenase (short-subunit alcohol dehydrogenase family)
MTNNAQRTWFVTGASRGFGRALCEAVLARGERLVAAARGRDFGASFARGHPDALAVRLDVTDPGQAQAAVEQAIAHFGRLDVVVNNAGYGHFGAIEELSDDELRRQFEVNLFGVLGVTRAALPQLRRQRSGHIVQISSLNGIEGMVGGGYYCASKFAVEGFSESLAAEVAHLGIKVTIVEPGPHRTGFAGNDSALIAEPIDDYAESVGAAREALAGMDGTHPAIRAEPRRRSSRPSTPTSRRCGCRSGRWRWTTSGRSSRASSTSSSAGATSALPPSSLRRSQGADHSRPDRAAYATAAARDGRRSLARTFAT